MVPVLVFTDDDFDGYADRLFVDADFNNVIDKIHDIKKIKIEMEEIKFDEISPWRLKNNGSKLIFLTKFIRIIIKSDSYSCTIF